MQRIIMHYEKLYYENMNMTEVEDFGEDAIKVNYSLIQINARCE